MVDMTDSKSVAGDCVRVQVSSPVSNPLPIGRGFFLPFTPFAPIRNWERVFGIEFYFSCGYTCKL